MFKLSTIKKLFQSHSKNTSRETGATDNENLDKNNLDELLQFFPNQQTVLRRRFSENFYKCLDVHRRPRLVKKSGELNMHTENVHKHRRRLFSDIFNTILDVKWRWHLVFFFFSFVVSWFLFATIWYMIAFLNGDLVPQNNPSFKDGNSTVEVKKVCVHGIHDFTSALLYSVETQHTIGYGLRYITEECPSAIIFLMLQSCFGIFVQGLVAGVVFAKISRPNKRKRTIIFSHNACVSERDGKLCFMFKLANIRISQLSDARIKMHMIKSRRTSEGEFIPFQSYDMKVGHDWSGNDSIFFPWPKTIEHVIDEDSPMYEMCKQALAPSSSSQSQGKHFGRKPRSDPNTVTTTTTHSTLLSGNASSSESNKSIKSEDYEIVVILEGNIETTGASCHIRTSYLPQEILFGYRFSPIYPKFTDFEYLFDYSKFDHVEPIQYELLGLNVAFINRQDNYVYDAGAEAKNLYQTVQNTEQNLKYFNKKPSLDARGPENSIFSLLRAFGQQPQQISAVEEKSHDLTSLFEEIKTPLNTTNDNLKPNCIEQSTFDAPNLIQPKQMNRTGRFTVEAVKTELAPAPSYDASELITQTTDETAAHKSSPTRHNDFKKTPSYIQKRFPSSQKQVVFQHSRTFHHRTSSLPPSKPSPCGNNIDEETDSSGAAINRKKSSNSLDHETAKKIGAIESTDINGPLSMPNKHNSNPSKYA